MGKIVLSKEAPTGEAVAFVFGNEEPLKLGGSEKKSVVTDNPVYLANAVTHPWLEVEPDTTAAPEPVYREPSVKPENDVLSAQNPDAKKVNDPKEVKKALEARDDLNVDVQPVAVEASKDQDKKVVTGGVAETLAADETHKGAKRAPATTDGEGS